LGIALLVLFVKGILAGLLASVPLGPAGVLCIQRTLNRGRLVGFMSGVGVALADTIFSVVAVFSLSVVESWVRGKESMLQALVGLVVVIVGVRIMLTNPVKQLRSYGKQQGSILGATVSLFFLTINPVNMLPILFMISLFRVSASGVWHGATVVAGVLIGTLTWWFILSTVVTYYRKHFKLRQMWWMNKLSGAIILFLGALAFVNGVVRLLQEWL
jgi:threonine/homoserine/homoserine lactone efflux protein